MNKQVLISIRPEHAINILNGSKTIELRKVVLKWVLEEVSKGNTVKFLMYCTKAEPTLQSFSDVLIELSPLTQKYILDKVWHGITTIYNGKVVASFEVIKIEDVYFNLTHWRFEANANGIDLTVDSCVTQTEIEKYFRLFNGSGKHYGYALHISNLNVFDKPKELSEFERHDVKYKHHSFGKTQAVVLPVKNAPQNMMTVWSN